MFACLYVPDFSVQAVVRLEPPSTQEALRRAPVAILDGPANLPKVIGLNDPARKLAIEVGMTKLQVETCGVTLRKRSFDGDERCTDRTCGMRELFLAKCGVHLHWHGHPRSQR